MRPVCLHEDTYIYSFFMLTASDESVEEMQIFLVSFFVTNDSQTLKA